MIEVRPLRHCTDTVVACLHADPETHMQHESSESDVMGMYVFVGKSLMILLEHAF